MLIGITPCITVLILLVYNALKFCLANLPYFGMDQFIIVEQICFGQNKIHLSKTGVTNSGFYA